MCSVADPRDPCGSHRGIVRPQTAFAVGRWSNSERVAVDKGGAVQAILESPSAAFRVEKELVIRHHSFWVQGPDFDFNFEIELSLCNDVASLVPTPDNRESKLKIRVSCSHYLNRTIEKP